MGIPYARQIYQYQRYLRGETKEFPAGPYSEKDLEAIFKKPLSSTAVIHSLESGPTPSSSQSEINSIWVERANRHNQQFEDLCARDPELAGLFGGSSSKESKCEEFRRQVADQAKKSGESTPLPHNSSVSSTDVSKDVDAQDTHDEP